MSYRCTIPFMVLDKANNVVLLRQFDKFNVVLEQLHGRFCDQDVHAPLNGVFGNRVVSG